MRRFQESQNNDFERSVKLGQDNAECLRQMRDWCKHVEIKRVSGGLYEQITGLPISSHSIGCKYVAGGSESMNLRWIFSNHLVNHCANCSYHKANGNTSWGQMIIENQRQETQRQEQAALHEANRISELRAELRGKTREISIEAEPEAYRILQFLEELFSEEDSKRNEASQRLKQSASIGPDLFPDEAIDFVLLLACSDEFAKLILPVCVELARGRSLGLTDRLCEIVFNNIEKGFCLELSASVLVALGDAVIYPVQDIYIERLLLLQNHYHPLGGWGSSRLNYSDCTTILVKSFDADPQSIVNVVRRELQNEDDFVRIHLCGALKLIQKERPQVALSLLKDLATSLELYEDQELGTQTPSGEIIHILQAAFQYSPEHIDRFLAESIIQTRQTVQADIVRIYRDQFIERNISWEERLKLGERNEVSNCEQIAIQRLILWMQDDRIEIDTRADVLEALEVACKYATAGVLIHFDVLLGYFAIISSQEHPPDPPPKILIPGQIEPPQLEQLNTFSRNQQWSIFKQRLQQCLAEICEAKPVEVFDSVTGCLNQSLDHIKDEFKACCVSLLGEIGKDYRQQPRVLPFIWNALMAYNSAWVRAVAINASVEVFSNSSVSPPTNLVDTIIIHLSDPIVAVHKAALRAVSWRSGWFDERQSLEVISCLAAHLHAYRDDHYQLDNICAGITAISRRNQQLKATAIRMIESIFPTGEKLVDSKIVEDLMRLCKPNEQLAHLVAKNIAKYLECYERDRYNDYGHSTRNYMFRWLHELPAGAYQHVEKDLFSSASILAERDAWEACQFASLFAHFRDYGKESKILEVASNSLPDEHRTEPLRNKLSELKMMAAGNAALIEGELERAKTCFRKGQKDA